MIRIPPRARVFRACTLAALLVSCATPPSVREIQPDAVAEIERKQLLKNERWRAEQRIYGAREVLDKDGATIGAPLRRDIAALVQALREALDADTAEEIGVRTTALEERTALLGQGSIYIDRASSVLSTLGDGLSPSLRAHIAMAIRDTQQAMHGNNWDDVRDTADALARLYWDRLTFVESFWEVNHSLKRLGSKVSPTLNEQIRIAVEPTRRALRTGTWDDFLREYHRLPGFVRYPQRIVLEIDGGRRVAEYLQPSERESMAPLFAALDAALQGNSWEQAFAAAQEIVAAPQRNFGNGEPLGWAPCVRILSIDGGGVRGIIPAMILAELERRAKIPSAKLFDYIVGTSTGGILALGVTRPNPSEPREPLYSAERLVGLYESDAVKIFPKDPLRTVRGLSGPKYSPEGLERVLETYFGNARVSDALTNVLITAYALELREHFIFSNRRDSSLFYMRDAARATSAAPTYFPPFQFRIPRWLIERERLNPETTITKLSLIDGGVFANNPAFYGLSAIRKEEILYRTGRYGDNRPWLVLSLGTGQVPASASFEGVENASSWGLLDWAGPLVDIVFSESGMGQGPERTGIVGFGEYYFRLQPQLDAVTTRLDNASAGNIQKLKEIVYDYVRREEKTLASVVALLVRERPRECQRAGGTIEPLR